MAVLFKALALAGVVPLLASASPEPKLTPPAPAVTHGTVNDGLPPERFRANGMALVVFTDRAGIDAACGVAQPPIRIIACTRRLSNGAPVVFMPNACELGATEFYAKIMCHEAGHVQGWSGNHED